MPDGRPGDHPLTDIAIHGAEYFDAESNERIRRMVNGAPGPLLTVLAELIFAWPRRRGGKWTDLEGPDGFRRVVETLEECSDALRRQR
jgi:hypothetical protein